VQLVFPAILVGNAVHDEDLGHIWPPEEPADLYTVILEVSPSLNMKALRKPWRLLALGGDAHLQRNSCADRTTARNMSCRHLSYEGGIKSYEGGIKGANFDLHQSKKFSVLPEHPLPTFDWTFQLTQAVSKCGVKCGDWHISFN
jgi:hypothetical protein